MMTTSTPSISLEKEKIRVLSGRKIKIQMKYKDKGRNMYRVSGTNTGPSERKRGDERNSIFGRRMKKEVRNGRLRETDESEDYWLSPVNLGLRTRPTRREKREQRRAMASIQRIPLRGRGATE